MRPCEHGKLFAPIELDDRRACFCQFGPKLFFAQEGVQKVIVRHEVARLICGIGSWQAGQPGIERVARPIRRRFSRSVKGYGIV
jgi:hypothetical protein